MWCCTDQLNLPLCTLSLGLQGAANGIHAHLLWYWTISVGCHGFHQLLIAALSQKSQELAILHAVSAGSSVSWIKHVTVGMTDN